MRCKRSWRSSRRIMSYTSQVNGANRQPSALASTRSTRIEESTGLDDKQDKRLKEACKDFEALFLSIVLKQMRKTVPKSELFGSDPAEETFQEMMDDEIGKAAAKTSSIGIADMLYRQLTSEMARGDGK